MKVFVAAGASMPNSEKHKDEARKLGYLLAEHKCDYYQGAMGKGLMGETYRAFVKKSSNVYLVSPKHFMNQLTDMQAKAKILTETINERLDFFCNICDVAVILPGGNGTLDEVVSLIETKRAREHNLEIIIVNIEGFWDSYINQMKVMEEFGYFKLDPIANLFKVVTNVEEAIQIIAEKKKAKDEK